MSIVKNTGTGVSSMVGRGSGPSGGDPLEKYHCRVGAGVSDIRNRWRLDQG